MNDKIPLQVESTEITAKTRKLSANWSVECLHGVEVYDGRFRHIVRRLTRLTSLHIGTKFYVRTYPGVFTVTHLNNDEGWGKHESGVSAILNYGRDSRKCWAVIAFVYADLDKPMFS